MTSFVTNSHAGRPNNHLPIDPDASAQHKSGPDTGRARAFGALMHEAQQAAPSRRGEPADAERKETTLDAFLAAHTSKKTDDAQTSWTARTRSKGDDGAQPPSPQQNGDAAASAPADAATPEPSASLQPQPAPAADEAGPQAVAAGKFCLPTNLAGEKRLAGEAMLSSDGPWQQQGLFGADDAQLAAAQQQPDVGGDVQAEATPTSLAEAEAQALAVGAEQAQLAEAPAADVDAGRAPAAGAGPQKTASAAAATASAKAAQEAGQDAAEAALTALDQQEAEVAAAAAADAADGAAPEPALTDAQLGRPARGTQRSAHAAYGRLAAAQAPRAPASAEADAEAQVDAAAQINTGNDAASGAPATAADARALQRSRDAGSNEATTDARATLEAARAETGARVEEGTSQDDGDQDAVDAQTAAAARAPAGQSLADLGAAMALLGTAPQQLGDEGARVLDALAGRALAAPNAARTAELGETGALQAPRLGAAAGHGDATADAAEQGSPTAATPAAAAPSYAEVQDMQAAVDAPGTAPMLVGAPTDRAGLSAAAGKDGKDGEDNENEGSVGSVRGQEPQANGTGPAVQAPGVDAATRTLQAATAQTVAQAQVSQELADAVQQGSRTIHLKVAPPGVGELGIHVRVFGGQVSMRVQGDSPELAQALRQNLGQLQETLQAKGLQLASMDFQEREQKQPGSNPAFDQRGFAAGEGAGGNAQGQGGGPRGEDDAPSRIRLFGERMGSASKTPGPRAQAASAASRAGVHTLYVTV